MKKKKCKTAVSVKSDQCRYRDPASGIHCRRSPGSACHGTHTPECSVPASSHHEYHLTHNRMPAKVKVRRTIHLSGEHYAWLKKNGGISIAIRVLIAAAMGNTPRVHLRSRQEGMTPDEAVYQFLGEKNALPQPRSIDEFEDMLEQTAPEDIEDFLERSSPDDEGLVV